jgi:serine/threonine protein kinase
VAGARAVIELSRYVLEALRMGVTFYEMLTGVLPFTASDPMEWVHCHIAREPVTPDQYAKEIPAPLSAIVMKLLALLAIYGAA